MRTGALLGVWLVGFGLLQVGLPLGTAVQIGADEDFELGKPTLWLHGHTSGVCC